MTEVRATFPTITDAQRAHERLAETGVLAEDMAMTTAAPSLIEETASEGRTMGRIVIVIALASVVGTGIGVALGALLHILIGPKGTSGLVIQVVSWAIFAHLLIGMWAGYFLLADRTEREIGRGRPVILVIQCANIDADTVRATLRGFGATSVDVRESAAS